MPRYVIERQFLVPMYEHIFVEAPSMKEACRRSVDDYAEPWGGAGATIDYDNARPTTVAQAVEIPEDMLPELRSRDDADNYDLSLVLYDSGLDLLPIPDEFEETAEEARDKICFA